MTAATVAAPANSINYGNKMSNVGLTPFTLSHAWVTAETDEANDVVEFGYLPGGVIVVAVLNASADLDSGSALRQTIILGTTDLKTGSTVASAGGGEMIAIVPQTLLVPTLVSVKTTTGATGHQNGVQYLTFLYYSGA